MAGRRSLKTLSVIQLTLPPETIASCYWRSRHPIPTAFRTAPGSAEQAKGAVKETAGKVFGDKKLEAEGKTDKAAGKLQNAVGGIKDAVRGK